MTLITGVLSAAIVAAMSLMSFVAYYTDRENRVVLKQYYGWWGEEGGGVGGGARRIGWC